MYCDGSNVTSDQAGRERGLETMANHFSAPAATTLLLNACYLKDGETSLKQVSAYGLIMDTCRASTTKYFGEWVCKASRRPSVALSWGKSMPSLGGAAFASGVRAGTGCWWKEGLRCLSSVSAP